MHNRNIYWLLVPILAAFLTGISLFCGHYADDALIAYRYAENLIDSGQFVYNLGEPVSALTSPLHTLLCSALYYMTGQTLRAYQVAAFAFLLLSVGLILLRFRHSPCSQVVVALNVLTLPCVILWSFGGLETNLLMLWVSLLCLAATKPGNMTSTRLCIVFLLAGICFVTRYDSCLFAGPIVLHAAWRNRRPAHMIAAIVIGAAIPAAWLIFSKMYYGDIFPTSFYIKASLNTRDLAVFAGDIWRNLSYMMQFPVLTGMLPVLLFAVLFGARDVSASKLRQYSGLPLVAGLAMVFAYGLAVATVHMMYSFRLFVPYVPAMTILLAGMYSRMQTPRAGVVRRFAILVTALALFQAWQSWYTYAQSANGAVLKLAQYEGTWLGTKTQEISLRNFRLGADDIRKHWENLPGRPDRPPRIWTFAGGTTPYYYREAYVFEALASYRHYCRPPLKECADYIQIPKEPDALISTLLPAPEADYVLISTRKNPIHPMGVEQRIYYHPNPLDNPLPPRINGLCPDSTDTQR